MRQTRELKAAGAQQIFLEYEHGDSAIKEQLSTLLELAQEGDTILTLEVSRLARSTKQLCDIIDTVKEKHLRLSIVGSICVDCTSGQIDPMTNAFIQISGVFAELELRIIRERVRSGMANAKAKGKRVGRPKSSKEMLPDKYWKYEKMYQAGEISIAEFARLMNCSRTTIYKYLSLE